MPPFLVWSEWKPLSLPGLALPGGFGAAVLAEILDGGQAFRWSRTSEEIWQGVWSDCVARLKLSEQGEILWSAPQAIQEAVGPALAEYFAFATDYRALADRLPWRSDAHLARCLEKFPGLLLLRQPLGETLLGFLCSSTKQIVQIKQMCELLAQKHGKEIVSGFHRLPTWAELAAVTEDELRACQLGFRARYIRQTALFLAANSGWLEAAAKLPYPEAKAKLRELSGVGEKIADCVLLLGAGRLEAFPVDVWIVKAMEQRYGLAGWSPSQTAHFGRMHFGPVAGLAQQYLFAYERAVGK
jgi:N-glycosylase/DNA lyase